MSVEIAVAGFVVFFAISSPVMAQGLGMKVNEEPRVKETEEKKLSGKTVRKNVEGRAMGSRRIFAPHFKLKVLDSYRQDSDCRGNQRATARKYGIHRRQIQKWLQVEASLRTSVETSPASEMTALNLCADAARQLDDTATGESRQATCQQGGSTSTVPREEMIMKEPRLSALPSFPVEDSVPDDEQLNRKVTVTLFPSVKIEQLEIIKRELPINLICNNVSSKEESSYNSFSKPVIKIEGQVELELKEELVSEDEDINIMGTLEPEQALDFTCAALSKRRSFSLQFKLEVLDAFHADRQCRGNQRATARKFGINRRQVQKWLHQEQDLRGETISRGDGLFRQRLGRWIEADESRPTENQETPCSADFAMKETNSVCWDLSNRKRKSVALNVIPFKKRTVELLKEQNKDNNQTENVTSSAENVYPAIQESALCLVKAKCQPNVTEERSSSRNSEVSSSADLNRVIGQALYHSNREHIIPPYIHFPIPTLAPSCFPPSEVGFHDLHHMLSFYRGFVADTKLRENLYPLDFKLKALDCYHGDRFCRGNQYAVASRFGIDEDQIQKWLKQEDQLRLHNDASRMLNVFR